MVRMALESTGILAAATTISFLFHNIGLSDTNIVMAYLIAVVLIALRTNLPFGMGSSVLSVLLFNFLFTAPRFSFSVNDTQYLFTFAVMFAVALITSVLTSTVKRQRELAVEREERTAALYRLSRALLVAGGESEILTVAAERIGEALGLTVRFLKEPPAGAAAAGSPPGAAVALDGVSGPHGFLALEGPAGTAELSREDRSLLDAFAAQLSLALDRARSEREQAAERVRAETEKSRSTILRSISHDLRTPLATISGSSSTLLDEWDSLDAAVRRELLSDIYDESAWLAEVVENLLSLNRLQNSPELVRTKGEVLDDVLYSAVQRVRKRAGGRSVSVSGPQDLLLVPMDGTLVEQALVNIIDNAIRHTPEGSSISVAARLRGDGGLIEFSVEDDGPGFPPDLLPRVFDLYAAGTPERKRGRGGVGLGLGICRAIVEAHGGTIAAENRSGGGARVSFTLPIRGEGAR
jgi:two-component system sensor histidine kinase KdpD